MKLSQIKGSSKRERGGPRLLCPARLRGRRGAAVAIRFIESPAAWNKCIGQARDNPLLKDFRKWVSSQTIPKKGTQIRQMKRDVETAIRKSEDEIFLKTLDRRTCFLSIGKTTASTDMDILVPGVSTVVPIADDVKEYFDDGKRRWQAFFVSMRKSVDGSRVKP